jgi:hypothetical protein
MTHAALARHYRSLNPSYTDDQYPPERWPETVLIEGIVAVEFPPADHAPEEYRYEVGSNVVLDGVNMRVTARTWYEGDRGPHYHVTGLGTLWIAENTLVPADAPEAP